MNLRFVWVLVAVGVAGACGGSTTGRSAPGSGGASADGGSASEAGGTAGSSGGRGAAAGTGGSDAGSGSGGLPADCSLPPDPGPCDANITSYYYDVTTQRCQSFVYGGCEGNGNNFPTLADCQAACATEPEPALDQCVSPSDCQLVPRGCCDPCEPVSATSFVALNREALPTYLEEQSCAGVDCAACPDPAPGVATRQNLGVRCDAGTCTVFDVRQSELATCSQDSDCALRAGIDCCEACTPDSAVAVSVEANIAAVVCGDEPRSCPGCEVMLPLELSAVCIEGYCAVRNTDQCTLAPETGDCTAVLNRYYYDAATGRCETFVYGGCGGNSNNFETLAACEAACAGVLPPRPDACSSASDCQLVGTDCCGPCEPVTIEGLVAISRAYLPVYLEEQGCGDVVCGDCLEPEPGTATGQNFGVRCEDGTCTLFDVRQTELAACAGDSDCRLRAGLGCCEDCSAVEPVAVSVNADIEGWVCGDEPVDCATCEPVFPPDRTAVCVEGACAVSL